MVEDKQRDIISVSDFASATDAASNSAGGVVIVPAGATPTLPASYPNVTFDYLAGGQIDVYTDDGSETTRTAKRIIRGYNAGAHNGAEKTLLAVESHPVGSGTTGLTSADFGITLSVLKKDFDTTATVGEIDGINIVVRQGGANSDAAGVLINAATYGTGFVVAMEGQTSSIPAGVITQQIQTQVGVCDNVANSFMGFFANKNTGAGGSAFYGGQTAASRWDNFLLFAESGTVMAQITSAGNMKLAGLMELTAAATAVASGVAFGGTTAATATAGGGVLPAAPAGFLVIYEAGTQRKIPYYNA
jgi:hypothetical protein